MNRNLDGVYFRVKRDDHWQNICFSDLTEKEMDNVMKDKSEEWLRNMCKILGATIKDIGVQFGDEMYMYTVEYLNNRYDRTRDYILAETDEECINKFKEYHLNETGHIVDW